METVETLTQALETEGDTAALVDLYGRRARAWLAQGRRTEAREDLETALLLDESHALLHGELARLLAADGDARGALAAFEAQARLLPAQGSPRRELGLARLAVKDTLGALADFEAAAALAPDEVATYLVWGHTLEGRAQPAAAERVYGLGLARGLEGGLSRARGLLRLGSSGQEEGAIADLSAALADEPGDVELRRKRAMAYRGRRQFEEASADLEAATGLAWEAGHQGLVAELEAELAALPPRPAEGIAPAIAGARPDLAPVGASLDGRPVVVGPAPPVLAAEDEALTYSVGNPLFGVTSVQVGADGRVRVERTGPHAAGPFEGRLAPSELDALRATLARHNPRLVAMRRMGIPDEAVVTLKSTGPAGLDVSAWAGEARDNPIQRALGEAFMALARRFSQEAVTF